MPPLRREGPHPQPQRTPLASLPPDPPAHALRDRAARAAAPRAILDDLHPAAAHPAARLRRGAHSVPHRALLHHHHARPRARAAPQRRPRPPRLRQSPRAAPPRSRSPIRPASPRSPSPAPSPPSSRRRLLSPVRRSGSSRAGSVLWADHAASPRASACIFSLTVGPGPLGLKLRQEPRQLVYAPPGTPPLHASVVFLDSEGSAALRGQIGPHVRSHALLRHRPALLEVNGERCAPPPPRPQRRRPPAEARRHAPRRRAAPAHAHFPARPARRAARAARRRAARRAPGAEGGGGARGGAL